MEKLKQLFLWLFGCDTQVSILSEPRSSQWRRVRAQHLLVQPNCQVCGGNTELSVHHIVPFHLDKSKECDLSNLITLCGGSHHLNCHLLFGHLQDWHSFNPNVVEDAKIWSEKLKTRSYEISDGSRC